MPQVNEFSWIILSFKMMFLFCVTLMNFNNFLSLSLNLGTNKKILFNYNYLI